jgi:hypothetical protein
MVSVDYLRSRIYNNIIGDLDTIITDFKVGTSNTTPSETTLTDLIAHVDITIGVELKNVGTKTTTTNSIVSTCVLDYTEANGNELHEIGLFDVSENLLTRKTFSTVNKTSDRRIIFRYTVQYIISE